MTEEGISVSLRDVSPELLKACVRERVFKMQCALLDQMAARTGLMKEGEQADWKTIADYLRSKTSGGNKQNWRLLQRIWDVLPMHKWLHDHGWETDGKCQCGEGPDDLTHREDC